jgi:hypothetical protein
MRDNPKKTRLDRKLISSQDHEIAYVRRKLARENPHRSPEEILRAITAVKKLISPSDSRARFMLVCHFMLNPR